MPSMNGLSSADAGSSLEASALCGSFAVGGGAASRSLMTTLRSSGSDRRIASWFSMIRIIVDAVIVDDGIQAWSFLALLEQDLGCRGVERGCAHKIDHAHEQRECRNRGDEHPMAPDEIQILAQVKRALRWLSVDPGGNPKSDVHRLDPLSGEQSDESRYWARAG